MLLSDEWRKRKERVGLQIKNDNLVDTMLLSDEWRKHKERGGLQRGIGECI